MSNKVFLFGYDAVSPILNASASVNSVWLDMTQLDQVNATVILTTTAVFTGNSTLQWRGTNSPGLEAASPVLTDITNPNTTALPAGATFTGGVLTFALTTYLAGTTILNLHFPTRNNYMRAEWVNGGGGGTVSMKVYLAGWSQ